MAMSSVTSRGVRALGVLFGIGILAGCGVINAVDAATDYNPAADALGIGATSVSQEKACTDGKAFAKAQCDRGQRCSTNDSYWFWGWGTGEQCEHAVASWYIGIFMLAGKDDRVEACQRELEAPGCGATPACDDLNRDKRRESGVECGSTSDCKVGLACIESTCTERKADGAKCSDSDDCKDGLSCQKDVCKPVTDGVTACKYSEDCHVTRDGDSGFFALHSTSGDKFVCDDATLKCKAVVRDRKEGEKCGEGRLCVAGQYCKGRLLNGEGTCVPQIKFGEKCDGLDGCYSCQDGICKDPLEGTCK